MAVIRLAVLFLLAGMAATTAAADAEGPKRIASLGVCADQFILGLVTPDRIAALSPYAADPALSLFRDRARGLPVTRGSAEELIALKPDLVVANRWGQSKTLTVVERLGIPVLRLTLPTTFAEVMAETRRVAKAFGVPERGERLIAAAQARIAAVRAAAQPGRPKAVYIMPGGYTAGRESFVDTVFTNAGADNIAATLGKTGWTGLPLEELVRADPDVLVFGFFRPGKHSLATRYRRHGLLTHLAAEKSVIDMPDRFWICGGWFLHEAVSHLAKGLRR